jgi:two-component system, OmpR family, sensor histidine kinase KdpD
MEAAFALPLGFAGMLVIGVIAVYLPTTDRAGTVLALTCCLMFAVSAVSAPITVLPLAAVGWFTVAGFARKPIGDLHGVSVLSLGCVAGASLAGGLLGLARRRLAVNGSVVGATDAVSGTINGVRVSFLRRARMAFPPRTRVGLSRRRLLSGFLLAAVLLPAVTALLVLVNGHLAFVDDLLVYLLTVIGITLVGGLWPAVGAAIAAGLLVNWFFTPPLHTWKIEDPTNVLALLLFVVTAVVVSSVVHLAARRGQIAIDRAAEADALLALARTVLGDDSPQAVLAHMRATLGVAGVLEESAGGKWVRVAGRPAPGPRYVIAAGATFRVTVYGDVSEISPRLLEGFAAQAASSCERQRLRVQAEQSEALAAGNRMRTALLAAVSHDLRTPLSSVKASVSTLRQEDVQWTEEDRAELLATIEEGADRLSALIGNLLDMSRIHTGAVQPFLRPVSVDEIVPAAVHSIDAEATAVLDVPDDLPLVNTDPVLLERALANVVSNAARFSPVGSPPRVIATCAAGSNVLTIDVVDHGPGIPDDQRNRVFEPFQQLGDRRSSGGVGLGLAVAKGFVEAVGGRIEARSTPGGGLTMRVELPIAASQPRQSDAVL